MRDGERQQLVSLLARLDQKSAALDEFLGLPARPEVARVAVAMREEVAELSAGIEQQLLDHVEH
jgi:hypothetical protein